MRVITTIILLLLLNFTYAQINYYVSTTGSDAANGLTPATAWQTSAKVNSFFPSLNPGDSVLFKRGDTFYGQIIPSKSGIAGSPIVIGAYGTGAKPKILGSAHINQTSDWTSLGGNIWQCTNSLFTTYPGNWGEHDVANLIFNGEATSGVKLFTATPTFTTQGQFWYDFANNLVKMYSVGNPAIFYTDIQAALKWNGLGNFTTGSYLHYENLDFRYWGVDVTENSTNFSVYKDLDISFIGGATIGTNYTIGRYGNGLQIWAGQHDITIERCNISNVYDAAISPQTTTNALGTAYNIYIRNNTISKSEYSLEIFERNPEPFHDFYFEHNTCIDAGKGWSHNQRPDGVNGCHIRLAGGTNIGSNVYIRNNVFYGAANWIMRVDTGIPANNFGTNYNDYRITGSEVFANNGGVMITTLANWKTASGYDANSINTDPLFVNYPSYLYLQSTSPARSTGFGSVDMGAYPFTTKYYVSMSTGNDGNSGTSESTAWKTIAKVNAMHPSMAVGDSILFKSGDTWIGETIRPGRSGTAVAPMLYGRYGAGAKPVITGQTQLSGWVNTGGNIWEANVAGSPRTVNSVSINGINTPMGRWPNRDSANEGYRTYTSFTNGTSLTDGSTVFGTWTGGQLVVRETDFTTKRINIISRTGNTWNFSAGSTDFHLNYGYFVQNHIATLDQNGEWFYDVVTKKLKMYYVGTPPSNIKVTNMPSSVNMVYDNIAGTQKQYITFKGLNFVGADSVMMPATWVTSLTVDSCDFSYAGFNAIDARYTPFLKVTNSTFTDINDIGIFEYANYSINHDITISNNNLKRIGIYLGMMSPNTIYAAGQHSVALTFGSGNLVISRNVIDSTGYAGISTVASTNNQLLDKNYITHYCITKNDGGGIYNGGLRGSPFATGIIWSDNIVGLGGSPTAGTNSASPHVRGLYLDATSQGINMIHNTVFSTNVGIYISQAQRNVAYGNTIFDCGLRQTGPTVYTGGLEFHDYVDGYEHVSFNNVTNNIIFNKYTDSQLPFFFTDKYNNGDSLRARFDSNYYINTADQSRVMTFNSGPSSTFYTLPAWQSLHAPEGYDIHSHSTPMTTPALTAANWFNYLRFEINPTDTVKQILFPGQVYMEASGKTDTGSVLIPRWSSLPLIYVGAVNTLPVVSTSGNTTTSLPITSVPVSGSATDPDGIITLRQWSQQSGPATVSFTNPNSDNTIINGLTVVGAYSIKYEATGSGGPTDKSSSTLIVTVTPPANVAPVISPNPLAPKTITAPASSTTATVSATDADGSVTNYRWFYNSGPSGATITNGSTATATFGGLVPGNYSFGITVKDNLGDSAVSSIAITVNPAAPPPNLPPIINPNPVPNKTIQAPTSSTTATVNATDADGTVNNYRWDFVSGGTVVMTNRFTATCSFSGLVPGTYNFTATVFDDDGDSAKANFQLVVNPPIPNIPPVINPSPIPTQTIYAPTSTASATVVATDGDGTVNGYRWDYQSGPSGIIMTNRTTATCNFANLSIGTSNFTVTVFDDDGDSTKANFQIVVNPAPTTPPIPNAGADKSITAPTDNSTLSGNGTDGSNCNIVTHEWEIFTKPLGSSPTIANSGNYTTAVANMTVVGAYVYRLKLTSLCSVPVYDYVTITVLSEPTASTCDNCVPTFTKFRE